jgi:hypothetical protein
VAGVTAELCASDRVPGEPTPVVIPMRMDLRRSLRRWIIEVFLSHSGVHHRIRRKNTAIDWKFTFRNHKQANEILDLRGRKPEADVSNPYSVRIDELRFQHGADFLKVIVALLAVQSGQKTLFECFQPPDDSPGSVGRGKWGQPDPLHVF